MAPRSLPSRFRARQGGGQVEAQASSAREGIRPVLKTIFRPRATLWLQLDDRSSACASAEVGSSTLLSATRSAARAAEGSRIADASDGCIMGQAPSQTAVADTSRPVGHKRKSQEDLRADSAKRAPTGAQREALAAAQERGSVQAAAADPATHERRDGRDCASIAGAACVSSRNTPAASPR